MPMLCAIDFTNLHSILRSLYDEMMPLCSDMAGVAQVLPDSEHCSTSLIEFGSLWQMRHPLMCSRFFVLSSSDSASCSFRPWCSGTINSVMSPIVQGTASMLEGQTLDMKKYREEKDRLEYEQMMRDPSTAYLVDDAEFDRQIDELR